MALIFVMSSLHKVELPYLDRPSVDKLYHSMEYAILGYLVARALDKGFRLKNLTMVISAILFTAIYGYGDEIHQTFVPGRFFSYWDITADTLGAIIGTLLYRKLRF